MAVATFDTLKFANSLKAAGLPDKQAEAEAAAISEALAANFKDLVTKEDLKNELLQLRTELKNDGLQLRTELKSDIRETEQRLNAKIEGSEQRLNAKIDTAVVSLKGEILTIKYMFGIVVTLFVGIAIRVFLAHSP